ncbi:MAG: succinylglutamate desuccinylase/aspartoacylase family protein, partial [Mesorhizobium sp.]
MQKDIERIAGDAEGTTYEFPVFRFEGTDKAAPRAYLQAALHAGELPGV